jgi:FAD/FMN-containing dehydrogenase
MDAALRARLAAIVGTEHMLDHPELTAGYEQDVTGRFRGSAAAVVRPGTSEEVAAVLAACSRAGVAVVPQGGNTGLVGGQVPRGGEVVLSLARLTAIGPLDPVAGQITVEAGVTPAALAGALRGRGLALGVDFGARDSATIGGMVATDAGGAQVLRHGTMRARVAGVEAVLADGRVLRRLSGLVKDNAGYDLPALLIGSEGTLAVITAVRLALVPAPDKVVTALLGLASLDDAVGLVARLRARLASLQAADFFGADGLAMVCAHRRLAPPFPESHAVYLLLECGADADPTESLAAALEDEPAVADVAVADDTARRAALWTYREAHNEAVAAAGVPHKLDVSVPLPAIPAFAAELVDAVGARGRTILYGHLGDGNVHVNVLGPDPDDHAVDEAVLRLVAAHGGSVSAEHGIGIAKRAWLGLTRTEEEIAAMRAIKAALDPAGVLNPGAVLSP